MKAILCPEDNGSHTLELYDDTGSWLMCLAHGKDQTFLEDLERQLARIPLDEVPAGWEAEVRKQVKLALNQI